MFDRIKRLLRKPPLKEFLDPELGRLTATKDLWDGKMRPGGLEIPFCVGGTDTAPDPGLLNAVRSLSAHFGEVDRLATDFLREREPETREARLECYMVAFLWPERPGDFDLEFLADADNGIVWRVGFVNGRPHEAGFDD